MNANIKNIVEAMGGDSKKKGKKYVDPEEYEKITGKKAEVESDDDEGDEEEGEEMLAKSGKKGSRIFSLMISLDKKK